MKNKITQAKLALEGKNYEVAYELYSDIINEYGDNYDAWIGKAICAGYVFKENANNIEEAKVLFEYANSINKSGEKYDNIDVIICSIAKNNVDKLIGISVDNVQDFGKNPLSTFQLSATRKVENVAKEYSENNKVYEQIVKSINILDVLLSSFRKEIVFEYKINLIDYYLDAIDEKIHIDKYNQLIDVRNNYVSEVKLVNPSFNKQLEVRKSDGCYIATAVYGDFNSSEVVYLRNYRDVYLMNNSYGKYFVEKYYRYSPYIANKLKKKVYANLFVRYFILNPIVYLLKSFKVN